MTRRKLLRLGWVAVLVVSAFALGAFLKPSFTPAQRTLRAPPPLAPPRMPPPMPPPSWQGPAGQPRR